MITFAVKAANRIILMIPASGPPEENAPVMQLLAK
jgi:hypothetical protein